MIKRNTHYNHKKLKKLARHPEKTRTIIKKTRTAPSSDTHCTQKKHALYTEETRTAPRRYTHYIGKKHARHPEKNTHYNQKENAFYSLVKYALYPDKTRTSKLGRNTHYTHPEHKPNSTSLPP
jgi:hypothetical protein